MPDLHPVALQAAADAVRCITPARPLCPRCLGAGRVWDLAHRLKVSCTCQHVTGRAAA